MPKPKLVIEINGNEVTVSGEREVMEKILPLGFLDCVETEGVMLARIHDPIPHANRVTLNALLRMRMAENGHLN